MTSIALFEAPSGVSWCKLWRESYHGAIGSISFEVE